MSEDYDAFGNDRNAVRVPFDATTTGFDDIDLMNVRSAIRELGGFDGAALASYMALIGVSDENLRELSDRLDHPGQLGFLTQEELCALIALCNVVCAALGDEELATLTTSGRDEHFLTIRRLYHAFRRQARSQRT